MAAIPISSSENFLQKWPGRLRKAYSGNSFRNGFPHPDNKKMEWDMRITNAVVVFLTHQETARLCRTTMACYAFTSIKLRKEAMALFFLKNFAQSSRISSKKPDTEASPYSILSKGDPETSYYKMNRPFAKGTSKSVYLGLSQRNNYHAQIIIDCMNLKDADTKYDTKHSHILSHIIQYLGLAHAIQLVAFTKIERNADKFLYENAFMQRCSSPLVHQFSDAVYSDADNTELLVSELAFGESLHEFLTQNWTPLSYFQRKSIVQQIAQSLASIHSKEIVHGDLKLNNILVFQDRIQITDFGRSAFSGFQFSGLSSYMPPEALEVYEKWTRGIKDYADQHHWDNEMVIKASDPPKFTMRNSFDTWTAGHLFSIIIFDQPLRWQTDMIFIIRRINSYFPNFTFKLKEIRQLSKDIDLLLIVLNTCYESSYWQSFYPDQISHPMMPLLYKMCHPDPLKRPSMSEVVRELHKI